MRQLRQDTGRYSREGCREDSLPVHLTVYFIHRLTVHSRYLHLLACRQELTLLDGAVVVSIHLLENYANLLKSLENLLGRTRRSCSKVVSRTPVC